VRMVAAHALAHLHAMREAISGNQWQSVAISGKSVENQWPHTPSRTSLIGW
jgi:hypothetical protein